MRHLLPLAAAALLVCSVAAADTAPSLLGDTGLILTPNALTAGRHTATVHSHAMLGNVGDPDANDSGEWDSIGALFGLTDRLELYLGYLGYEDNPCEMDIDEQEHFVAHIKALALREPDDCVNLAIGIRNMGMDSRNSWEGEPTVYAVATKTVCGSEEEDNYLRLSFGAQFANEDDTLNEEYWPEKDGADFDRDSVFGSAEWRVCDLVTLMGEIQHVGDDEHVTNFGARVHPWDDVTVDAALIEDVANDDRDWVLGASWAKALDSGDDGAAESRETSEHATAPSHFGDTGIILMPNAMIAPRHTVAPTYHSIASGFGDDDSEDGGDIGDWQNAGLLVGATDRLEVYAGLLAFDDDPHSSNEWHQDEFIMHAKAQALREPDQCLNLAVGVRNIGLDTVGDTENEPSGYIVASKTLFAAEDEDNPSFFRASAGVLLANEDGLLNEEYFTRDDYDEYESCSLFGGIEWMMGKYVTLLGEVIEVGDDEAALNFGARLTPCDDLTVDVLLVDDSSNDDYEFGWGASYRIPF
jgi:hypothetical protein